MTWNSTAEQVFGHTILLSNRIQRLTDAVVGPDLTGKQWLMLIVLRSLEQPVTSVQRVAEIMGTSHQNVTKMVATLADAGWVERRRSDDRRKWELIVTARAETWLAERADLGENLLRELFDGLSVADLATTLATLERGVTQADEMLAVRHA